MILLLLRELVAIMRANYENPKQPVTITEHDVIQALAHRLNTDVDKILSE